MQTIIQLSCLHIKCTTVVQTDIIQYLCYTKWNKGTIDEHTQDRDKWVRFAL